MRNIFIVVLAFVVGVMGSAGTLSAEGRSSIVVEQAWARASIVQSRPGAAYLTIGNEGSSPDRLVGTTSPLAGSVTIHASEMSDNVMKMRAMHQLEIGQGERVVLKPGGMHLMLMHLREPLREGERLPLVLEFEHAGKLEVSVPILSPAAKGPENE